MARLTCVVLLAALLTPAAVASAHPAVGVVVDSRGTAFYSDLRHVWAVHADGRRDIAVRDVHTHELYIDERDVLYGEHLWYEGDRTGQWGHYVWKRTPDGVVTRVIPPTKGFLTNYSFVRDRAGNMYWPGGGAGDAGPRTTVARRSPDGRTVIIAGGARGSRDGKGRGAGFSGITWMSAAADGTIFAIDGADLRRVSPDGTVLTLARNLRARTSPSLVDRVLTAAGVADRHYLMGVWPDGAGGAYVANQGARIVEHVDARGVVMTVYKSPAPHAPTGVTVSRGELVVLEYSTELSTRVVRVTSAPRSR